MADLPSVLEPAVQTILAAVHIDFPTALIVRLPVKLIPEAVFGNPGTWPAGIDTLIEIVDCDPLKDGERSRGDERRFQETALQMLIYLTAAGLSGLSAEYINTRRRILNTMERLELSYSGPGQAPWWIKFARDDIKQIDPSPDKVPYIGMNVPIPIEFFE